jgi:superfamily II DNA/RNA helicase
LHSKAYIFDYGEDRYEKGTTIIGSSNLSFSGFVDNTELNAVLPGNANHEKLSKWFNDLWKDSEDFNIELLKEINESWAINQVRPYDIYIKTLYTLLKDRLETERARELLWEYTMPPLTDFQKIAVMQALQVLNDYDGVIIGDVVGLGKTYIGVALLKHLQEVQGLKPIVIAPPAIEQYWDDLLNEYGVHAHVLSMGMLSQGEIDLHTNPRYRDANVILIDESHNFRYPDTLRYKNLHPFLYGKKVILVTATPRNNTHWDIFNQIKLFHPEDPTLLPIDPPNLRQFFKAIDENRVRIQDLLRHILIRRTRRHILQWYGQQDEKGRTLVLLKDKPYYFPERELETVTYSIDKTYAHLYDKIYDAIRGLQYAKYGLWHYVKPALQDKTPYRELEKSGRNLRGLMKVLLLKRFESSVEAFRETIRRLIRIHDAFLKAMSQGIIPAGEEAQSLLYDAEGEDEQILMEQLEIASRKYDAKDFNLPKLKEDIKSDLEILKNIEHMVDPIKPSDDDKLEQLIKLLNHKDVKGKKTIIFTQYADTVKYLYQNLNKFTDIAFAYSKAKNRLRVVRLFAPKSNNYKLREGEKEITMLVSTDILSEGLNLQDAYVVINYDIHWNPVRLIQRIGRIDRMGAIAEVVQVYNFLPERALERLLGLHQRIARRIQEIHETIGEDSKILDKSEQLNEEAMYAIYEHKDSAALDDYEARYDVFGQDLFGLSEAEELIRQIKQGNPDYFEYIKNLPDGVRSAKHHQTRTNYVFYQSGDYEKLYLTDSKGKITTEDMATILSTIKCEKAEDPIPIPAGYNKAISEVKHAFQKSVEERAAIREARVTLRPQQRYILNHLQKLFESTEDEDKRKHIENLKEAIKSSLPPVVLQILNRFRREGVTGDSLFEKVKEIYFQYRLWKYIEPEEAQRTIIEPVRIVCSMAMMLEGDN